MNPERMRVVEELFRETVELDEKERQAFLSQRCGGDERLRQEVESLLTHHDASAEFLEHPVSAAPLLEDFETQAGKNATAVLPPARRIGSYTILDLLGAGGMSVVYVAEQQNPRRIVALKVLRPGLASAESLRRFEQEAQVLGRLQHPGIAQIHEAGTADAGFGPQPYLAMEWVHGPTLAEYVAEHRPSPRERLELLAKVCEAVHHAHQKGIVHRDLKPANILVAEEETSRRQNVKTSKEGEPANPPSRETNDSVIVNRPSSIDYSPRPKILDFGVARVIDADLRATLETRQGELVGTIAYMSPEQCAGDPHEVDTRSDIYALGVIGYELLAGRLPIAVEGISLPEAARRVREEEPRRLGLVDRALRGDPETIIAKALAKEASHRYQSAYDFAADIRRFLTDEPILARPPGGFYRLGKFARRHRAAAVASLLVLWALLLGIAGTSWQAWQARRQAEKAAHNQRWLQEMLKHIDPGWMNLRNVHELERSLSETAQTLSRTEPLHWSEFDADLSETLGLLYKSLERYDAAEHHLSLAYLTYENVLGSDHPQTLAALHNLGALYTVQERDLEAESWLRLALERRGRVLGEENRDTMETMMVLGKTLHHQQRFAEAEALFTEAVQHCRRDPASDGAATMIAMHCLGFVMRAQGKSAEAEPWLCAAYEWGASRLPRWNLLTLMSQREYGSCLADLGRYEDAEAYLLGAYQNLVNTTGAADVRTIYALNHVVELYEAWGKPEEAARYRRLLTAQEESP